MNILTGIAIFIFVFTVEPIIRKNRFFSNLSILTTVLFALIIPGTTLIWIPLGVIVVIAYFPIRFMVYLFVKGGQMIHKRITILTTSLILLTFGTFLNIENLLPYLPSWIYLIVGLYCLFLGLIGIFYSFYNLNVIIETGWQQYLDETLYS